MRAFVVGASVLFVVGCSSAHRFIPSSQVERASGDPSAAVVRRAGVTLIADAEGWSGPPAGVARVVTPIHVRILNDSDAPLAVRYLAFRLVSDLGREVRPLPPVAIDRSRPLRTRAAPSLEGNRFRLAPYYRDLLGDEVDYWTGGFHFDPYYYDEYLRWRADLPTESMVERALPEGVIQPGGWVAGFLYFEGVEDEAAEVTLHVVFDLPLGDERVATLSVPFVDARI